MFRKFRNMAFECKGRSALTAFPGPAIEPTASCRREMNGVGHVCRISDRVALLPESRDHRGMFDLSPTKCQDNSPDSHPSAKFHAEIRIAERSGSTEAFALAAGRRDQSGDRQLRLSAEPGDPVSGRSVRVREPCTDRTSRRRMGARQAGDRCHARGVRTPDRRAAAAECTDLGRGSRTTRRPRRPDIPGSGGSRKSRYPRWNTWLSGFRCGTSLMGAAGPFQA